MLKKGSKNQEKNNIFFSSHFLALKSINTPTYVIHIINTRTTKLILERADAGSSVNRYPIVPVIKKQAIPKTAANSFALGDFVVTSDIFFFTSYYKLYVYVNKHIH